MAEDPRGYKGIRSVLGRGTGSTRVKGKSTAAKETHKRGLKNVLRREAVITRFKGTSTAAKETHRPVFSCTFPGEPCRVPNIVIPALGCTWVYNCSALMIGNAADPYITTTPTDPGNINEE